MSNYKIAENGESSYMKACESAPLSIYQYSDAAYITDELIDKSENIFKQALEMAENEYKKRIEREFMSVRFLRLSRLPLDTPHRKEKIEKFFEDIKRFGITEIRERRSLAATMSDMLESQYVTVRSGCVLYYIMK